MYIFIYFFIKQVKCKVYMGLKMCTHKPKCNTNVTINVHYRIISIEDFVNIRDPCRQIRIRNVCLICNKSCKCVSQIKEAL